MRTICGIATPSIAPDEAPAAPRGSPTLEMVFLPSDPPRRGAFALFDPAADAAAAGGPGAALVLPGEAGPSLRTVPVHRLSLPTAIPLLGGPGDAPRGSTSWAAWAAVVRAALGIVADGRIYPDVSAEGFDCWRVLPGPEDDEWLDRCAAAFPPLAHCVPLLPPSRAEGRGGGDGEPRLAGPRALIRACWDAVADAIVRTGGAPRIAGGAFAERRPHRVEELSPWLARNRPNAEPGLVAAGLRVVLPEDAGEPPAAVLQLRSGPTVIDAASLPPAPPALRERFAAAEVDLAVALDRGARRWPPLRRLAEQRPPVRLVLTEDELDELLGPVEESLREAGIEVTWPEALSEAPLTLRAVLSSLPGDPGEGRAGEGGGDATFSLEALLDFHWEVVLGETALSAAEVNALLESGRRLVRLRDGWVRTTDRLVERLQGTAGRRLRAGEALAAALTGTVEVGDLAVPARAEGPLARLGERLKGAERAGEAAEPAGFAGALRPYQRRGLGWLQTMCELGLGGCLADDMGLGKTVQVIALHVSRAGGPTLVACPASLLGNWEREVRAFAPGVPVRRYHGGGRHLEDLAPGEVVLVTYGVLRRDRDRLAEVAWDLVVADEAQHVKNPGSHSARELRTIPARARLALTGTPVENRLLDLWSILDWTTPGLLGPLERFRRRVAGPVERGDQEATARVARLVQPFLLRRRKTDPDVAPDLPARTERDVVVPLTAEQVALYEAVVRETLALIRSSAGIRRRGLVLKLLTALKQICNHPAQYLGQQEPLTGRSGKLDALDELVDEILAGGESALVFTQYVGMGRLLQAHLAASGVSALFLHGAVTAPARDDMVRRFQAGEAPVFLLSLRAGGFGLNLTRATHVVHYDRWWNPAVEDQASDRAHRIGQDRPVEVHRLVTEGTVEDRIAGLIARKRRLAEAVVGSGEAWIGELSDAELAELVTLQVPE